MAKNKKNKRRSKAPPAVKAVHYLPAARHQQVTAALSAANELLSKGNFSQTLALCEQLMEIEPRNAEVSLTMATAYEHAGDLEKSEKYFLAGLKLAPNFLPAMVNFALMHYRAGFLEKALARFNAALALEPDFIPALDGASRSLFDLRRYQQAIAVFEKLARLRGTCVDQMELARVQELAGNFKPGLAGCQRALSVCPDKAGVEIMAGMFCLSHGEKAQAIGHFENALYHDRDAGFAHFHLAKTDARSERLPDIEKAISRSQDKSAGNVLAPLQFARGYILEKAGDHEQAFRAFKKANELVVLVKPDDNQQRAEVLARNQKTYTPEFVAELHKAKSDQSKRPVFVTGLPRSGTTLVEQIIAGHSKACGLGEVELVPLLLPVVGSGRAGNFLAAAKTYRALYPADQAGMMRMVDKSISSVLHLGAIVSMFPNARIICCERQPMDVAWSAFKQYFNHGALAYTYSFERLAQHQNIYQLALDHWQAKFPEQVLIIRYEDLVGDPKKHAKQLISYVNLSWEDSCLDFYKSQTPVRTASYDQVRQPVYTTSVGSWQAYEPWLGELKTLLSAQMQRYQGK